MTIADSLVEKLAKHLKRVHLGLAFREEKVQPMIGPRYASMFGGSSIRDTWSRQANGVGHQ